MWQKLFFAFGLDREVPVQVNAKQSRDPRTPRTSRRGPRIPDADKPTPPGKPTSTKAVGACRPAAFGQPKAPEPILVPYLPNIPKKRKAAPLLEGEDPDQQEDDDDSEAEDGTGLGCLQVADAERTHNMKNNKLEMQNLHQSS